MAHPTRHLKIAFNSWVDHYYAVESPTEEYDRLGLFNFVVKGLKFSFDYVIDDDIIEKLPNGTWTGVVGLLNQSEIDYAPSALTLREETWDAAAYNYPYAIDELTFVTKTPEYYPGIMALFQTLSLNVWLSLLACIILVTLVCFVALKHRYTLDDILLHVFAIGLNQEGNLVPKRAGESLLLCTWLFGMAVFSFCFKSVLLSFLAFPPVNSVKTVTELAAAIRAGDYKAVTKFHNDYASYLQSSPVEDFRLIGKSIFENIEGNVFHFIAPEFFYYPIKAYVYRRSEAPYGDWYISEDNMGTLYFATAVSKNFSCKYEMDMLVHRFLAAGIDQKISRFREFEHYTRFPQDFPDDGEILRKITLTDIAGALILLVSGHCLSVFVLIIECWLKRRERRRTVVRTMKKRKHRPKNKSLKINIFHRNT